MHQTFSIGGLDCRQASSVLDVFTVQGCCCNKCSTAFSMVFLKYAKPSLEKEVVWIRAYVALNPMYTFQHWYLSWCAVFSRFQSFLQRNSAWDALSKHSHLTDLLSVNQISCKIFLIIILYFIFFLNKNILNLQAFETWPYRKTLRIPWTANRVNEKEKLSIPSRWQWNINTLATQCETINPLCYNNT